MRIWLLLIPFILLACTKDEPCNESAEELMRAIEQNDVVALEVVCNVCESNQELGIGRDYSFPGDNDVVVAGKTYWLGDMQRYYVIEAGSGIHSERRMILQLRY